MPQKEYACLPTDADEIKSGPAPVEQKIFQRNILTNKKVGYTLDFRRICPAIVNYEVDHRLTYAATISCSIDKEALHWLIMRENFVPVRINGMIK